MRTAGSLNDAPDLLGILDYEISVLMYALGRHKRRAERRAVRDGAPNETLERVAEWVQLRLERLRHVRAMAEQVLQKASAATADEMPHDRTYDLVSARQMADLRRALHQANPAAPNTRGDDA